MKSLNEIMVLYELLLNYLLPQKKEFILKLKPHEIVKLQIWTYIMVENTKLISTRSFKSSFSPKKQVGDTISCSVNDECMTKSLKDKRPLRQRTHGAK